MTKALTEQWREGTLDDGYYYLKMKDKEVVIDHTEYIFWAKEIRWENKDNNYIKEVLAPVPSYEDWKKLDDELKEMACKNDTLAMENGRLEKQLAIATNALKQYSNRSNWVIGNFMCANNGVSFSDAERAEQVLKEIKEVK